MKHALLAALTLLAAVGTLLVPTASGQRDTRDLTVEQMRSERRVALVIGNAAYPRERLRNPVNDARAMAETLRGLGFEVLLREDVGEKDLRRAIDAFGERLRGSGVGLLYYSGHGLQVKGRNWLVPVDAKLDAESEVEYEAVDVGRVLAKMETVKNRLNIVVLDACRNNPFEKAWRTVGGGLAQMLAPAGTFIAYATAPGRTAADGKGPHSPYTGELLRVLREPGLTLENVFKRAGQAVRDRTGGAQEPWVASSVYGTFFFALPTGPGPRILEEPRPVGSLALTARIEGIEVYLGDERVGETKPGRALVVEHLAPGAYRVKARKAGYPEWEREVRVAANARAEVPIDIEPLRTGQAPVVRGDDGAEMVLVPAGEFWMGSDEYDREKPHRRVHLDGYYIDKYETTNALYRRFVQVTSRAVPAFWSDSRFNGDSQPVVGVPWHDADAYCRWAGKRLPSEAEWEKAARGADGRKYPWGDQWDSRRANSVEAKLGKTSPVGSYPDGASPYGAQDMAGNVWEWVADWYGPYRQSEERNPTGPPTGQSRVLRGGSWFITPISLRTAARYYFAPASRFDSVGFRCARGLP